MDKGFLAWAYFKLFETSLQFRTLLKFLEIKAISPAKLAMYSGYAEYKYSALVTIEKNVADYSGLVTEEDITAMSKNKK